MIFSYQDTVHKCRMLMTKYLHQQQKGNHGDKLTKKVNLQNER